MGARDGGGADGPAAARAERQAAALRANLARRKAQSRARRAGEAGEVAEGLPADARKPQDDDKGGGA